VNEHNYCDRHAKQTKERPAKKPITALSIVAFSGRAGFAPTIILLRVYTAGASMAGFDSSRITPMSWHKVTLPFEECGIAGKGRQLRDAFTTLLIANGGQPRDAALFSQTSDDYKSVFFYFSPAAVQIARSLIEQWHPVPCSGPPFPGKLVSLEAGDQRVWDLLGVNKAAGA